MTEAVTEPVASVSEDTESGPRMGLAVAAGIAAAIVGAILWAVFVYVTNMELGLVAIAVGALVGISVREAGRSSHNSFGIIGAVCAAFGWALGTVMCDVAILAKQAGAPFSDVISRIGASGTVTLAIGSSDAIDLLFLAIAVWEGYKFAKRPSRRA